MAKTATMTIRLDPFVKSEVENIYAYYGITLAEAVNIFFHQSINARGLPFDLRPTKETLEAIHEVDKMSKHPESYKGYSSAREMLDDIFGDEN
jgi:DNA-damage-inducible protein J